MTEPRLEVADAFRQLVAMKERNREYFSLIKKGEAMKEEQPQQRLKGPADYRGARRTYAL